MNRLFGDVGEGVLYLWREFEDFKNSLIMQKVDIHVIGSKVVAGYI
jgi:hypothetical protein